MIDPRKLLRFIWAHRTIALIVAACWNALMYFAWRTEPRALNLPLWLPIAFAILFALLVPVSVITERHRRSLTAPAGLEPALSHPQREEESADPHEH